MATIHYPTGPAPDGRARMAFWYDYINGKFVVQRYFVLAEKMDYTKATKTYTALKPDKLFPYAEYDPGIVAKMWVQYEECNKQYLSAMNILKDAGLDTRKIHRFNEIDGRVQLHTEQKIPAIALDTINMNNLNVSVHEIINTETIVFPENAGLIVDN